jgi:hypothetical protein
MTDRVIVPGPGRIAKSLTIIWNGSLNRDVANPHPTMRSYDALRADPIVSVAPRRVAERFFSRSLARQ